MALVNVDTLLQAAEEGGYAVGAFNCNNMEIVQAIIGAAEAEKSPVIIPAKGPSNMPVSIILWPWCALLPKLPAFRWPCTWTMGPALNK